MRLAALAIALFLLPAMFAGTAPDPFAWLQPVAAMDAGTRIRLDRGEVIVGVLPAVDAEIGIFAASRLNADGEMLAAWAESIAQLKKSPYVLVVRRFSDPPSIDDVQGMTLDDTDLETLRGCRAGNCDMKMAADDIVSLRQSADAGGAPWPTGRTVSRDCRSTRTAVSRSTRKPHSPQSSGARRT